MAIMRLLLLLFLATVSLVLLLDILTLRGVQGEVDLTSQQQQNKLDDDWRSLWESINDRLRAPEKVLEIFKQLEAILAESEVQQDSFATKEEIIELSRMGQMKVEGCTAPFIRALHKSLDEIKGKKGFLEINSLDRYKEAYGRKFLSLCLRNIEDELDFNGTTISSERKSLLEELVHKCEEGMGWELMNYRYEDFANFHYPQEIIDFDHFIDEIDTRNEQAKRDGSQANLTRIFQDVIESSAGTKNGEPIVPYTQFSDLEFLIKPKTSCDSWFGSNTNGQSESSPIRVIIVVKSAVNNYLSREVIRKTWAINDTKDSFKLKTVFIVSACDTKNPVPKVVSEKNGGVWTPDDCRRAIDNEARQYDDLVQASALDSYLNLTMKTAMMLHWVSSDCPSDFSMAIDDDYAFEVTNLIRYFKQLASARLDDKSQSALSPDDTTDALKKLAQEHLYAGFRHCHQPPDRNYFSLYRVSYHQYPFKVYPDFITGGLVLMSHRTARAFYLASHFVRTIPFEDVYMGITAHKLGLKPRHDANFQCKREAYLSSKPNNPNSTDCIGVHQIWLEDLTDLWSHRRQQ